MKRPRQQRSSPKQTEFFQIGTLIDPTERVVLADRADRISDQLTGQDVIPCLDDIPLKLTVQQLFNWIKVR